MRNIIDAICEIVQSPQYKLREYAESHNRANSMGGALEDYVKDIFAGSVGVHDENTRNQLISQSFSYLGNDKNPPDSILRGGDAIEVKKIESNDSALPLNSSYPKSKLYASSTMISKKCRTCEIWTEKDMIYVVGVVRKSNLTSLAMVYGADYCANDEVYKKIKTKIKEGVESIPGVKFATTKELGRVNCVDPLATTYLRVRGMWGIENPFKVFNYLYRRDLSKQFNLMAIINKDKFESFPNRDQLHQLAEKNKDLELKDVQIKDPNNPANLIPAILISYTV